MGINHCPTAVLYYGGSSTLLHTAVFSRQSRAQQQRLLTSWCLTAVIIQLLVHSGGLASAVEGVSVHLSMSDLTHAILQGLCGCIVFSVRAGRGEGTRRSGSK